MDPDQLAVLVAAAGSVLAALGIRQRKTALARRPSSTTTVGLVVGRAGAGAARVAGNVTGTTGRVAANTAAAGIRVGGATVAHSTGLAVDGFTGLTTGLTRLGTSLVRRTAAVRPRRRVRSPTKAPGAATRPAPAPATKAPGAATKPAPAPKAKARAKKSPAAAGAPRQRTPAVQAGATASKSAAPRSTTRVRGGQAKRSGSASRS